MKKKGGKDGFARCSSRAFGFGEIPSENNFDAQKILKHFNAGFKPDYPRREDSSMIEIMQNNFL